MTTDQTPVASVSSAHEVLFIDSRVPDLQAILAATRPGVKVVILDPNESGVAQMVRALEGEHGLASISVVSHGDEGVLLLGNGPLFSGNLDQHQAELQAIGAAMGPDGDLLLYGCDVGAGEAGAQFVQALAQLTGADVAASNDSTAGTVRGGDWDLEITTGQIEAPAVLDAQSLQGYDGSLVTTSVNTVAGLKAAITTGNTDNQDDIITLTGNITFASSLDAITINVTDGHTMNIVGGGFTLSGGNLARVLNVSSSGAGSSVLIDNLTISNGKLAFANGSGASALGAGISVTGTGTQVTILHSSIASNAAKGDAGAENYSGNGGNGGHAAGGLYIGSGATVQMATTSVTGNSGTGGNGGYGNNIGGNGGNGTGGVLVASGGTFRYEGGSVNISSNIGTRGTGGSSLTANSGTNGASTANISGTADNTWAYTPPAPTVTLSVSSASVAEAAGTATVTATLSAAAAADTTVTIGRQSGSTATLTDDFTLSSTTITIAAGQTTGTATLTAVQDAVHEGNETAIIEITGVSGGGGATVNGIQQQTVTIIDDDPAPSLSIANVSQAEGNSGSSNLTFTVTLSAASAQAVSVNYATSNGTATAGSDYTASSGTLTFAPGETTQTFTVTVAGDTTAELNEAFTVTLSNPANATLGTASATGTILDDDSDVTAPSVSSINRVGSATTNAASVQYIVTFSEPVTGVDTGDFALSGIGTGSGTVAAISGSGSTYTVIVNGITGDGTLRLDLKSTGTGIADAASNAIADGGFTSGQSYTLDHTAPTVTGVTATTADGAYTVGAVISIQVNFSEAVTVTDTPQLTLETGAIDRATTYTGGNGSSTLSFTYTVQAGDTTADLDYISTSALALNGSTLRDAAGNNAILTLAAPGAANSLGNNKAIVVDGVVPTVTSVDSSTANGTYKVGDVISVQVNFSEAVTVTGTPQLTLEMGAGDQVVNYATGSGTSTLTFDYTVQAGDTTADLDYLSTTALAPNGGTIQDAAGNNATLTLASPGAANSLGANTNIVIDTEAPQVVSVAVPADATYVAGQNLDFTVQFTEAVSVDTTGGTPRLALTLDTGGTVYANYLSGSSTSALLFRYTVATGVEDTTGVAVGALSANGGTLKDAADNDATLTLNSVGATGNVKVDGITPDAPQALALYAGSDSGTSNSDRITNDTTPTITGTAEAGSIVTLYDTDGTTILGAAVATGGNWSILSTALADGSHTFTATARDAGGNVSAASTGLGVTIDTTAPTVTITSDVPTTSSVQPAFITFTFSEEPVDFSAAGITVTGGTLGGLTATANSLVYTATFTPTLGTASGSATISVGSGTYFDLAGNNGNAYSIPSLNIDTVAPSATANGVTFSADSGVGGDLITNDAIQTLSGNLSAPLVAGDVVQISLDNGGTWSNVAASVGDTSWSAARTLIASDTLRVRVADAAGNTSTAYAAPYVLDTVAPTASIVLADSALTAGETTQVTITFSEAVTGFGLASLAAENGTLTQLTTTDNITWTVTLTPTANVADATNLVTLNNALVQDVAGNLSIGAVTSANYSVNTVVVLPPDPDPVDPTPPVTPPTPGIPDNDGIPATIEDQAPGIPGPGGTPAVQGDGNGDGIKDSEQAGVASIGFVLSPTSESNPGSAVPTFTTLVASSLDGKVGSGTDNSRITSLSQQDAPSHLPEGMQMPIGLVSFTVALGAGKTGENFSLYVDPALEANGYWKQDSTGTWVNIASEPYGGKMVMEGGRVRLDFHIEDGGQFDADGKVDGIITDPGAPAHMALSIVGMAPDVGHGFWF